MAKLPSKGTLLKVTISSVLTTLAQVIEIDKAQDQGEAFDADTLDNTSAYIPKQLTGRASSGDISGTLFYDPANTTHQFITDTIAAPVAVAGSILLSDATNSHTFSIVAFGMGLAARMNDGLKAPFTLIVNTTAWPT